MPPAAPQIDSTLVKAIARAFRGQKMLETGRYTTVREIARVEKINSSYDVARKFLAELLSHERVRKLLPDEHFSVDRTQVQAWA